MPDITLVGDLIFAVVIFACLVAAVFVAVAQWVDRG